MRWKFSHKDCFKNACSPRKFSRSLKSEDKDKDKDLQISLRGSSRTRTFFEDNNIDFKLWNQCIWSLLSFSTVLQNFMFFLCINWFEVQGACVWLMVCKCLHDYLATGRRDTAKEASLFQVRLCGTHCYRPIIADIDSVLRTFEDCAFHFSAECMNTIMAPV